MNQLELPVVNKINTIADLQEGVVLLIDKPYDWTSFDVVNKIKGACNQIAGLEKIKIGHAGTLDPLATGLLVICTGKMTKRIDRFQEGVKEYTGTIFLGQTTPSFDLETIPEGDFDILQITLELSNEIAFSFLGEQMQMPPAYSAKKVDGKRAYESAHQGIPVVLKPNVVRIDEFQITRFELPEVDFLITCSKGTYIRTIAHEFGQRMGSGSYLKDLRRTRSYPFDVRDSMSVNDLVGQISDLLG